MSNEFKDEFDVNKTAGLYEFSFENFWVLFINLLQILFFLSFDQVLSLNDYPHPRVNLKFSGDIIKLINLVFILKILEVVPFMES